MSPSSNFRCWYTNMYTCILLNINGNVLHKLSIPCLFSLNKAPTKSPLYYKSDFLSSLDFCSSKINCNSYWDNGRFPGSCKKIKIASLFGPLHKNGNILQNYSIISQPGYWYQYNPILFRFPHFYWHSFVYLCVCVLCISLYTSFFSCVGSRIIHRSQNTEWFPQHKHPPVAFLFCNHTHLLPAIPYPTPNSWQPVICPSFLKFCHSKNVV